MISLYLSAAAIGLPVFAEEAVVLWLSLAQAPAISGSTYGTCISSSTHKDSPFLYVIFIATYWVTFPVFVGGILGLHFLGVTWISKSYCGWPNLFISSDC